MKLTIVVIALTSLSFLAFGSLESLEQKKTSPKTVIVENNELLKKWKLSHHEIFGASIDPEEKEKNDYLHFLKNLTYKSVSEGKYETGKYRVEKSNIYLSNATEKGELKFIIKKLTVNKLEVTIDDPNDSDAKYLTIHFKGAVSQ